MNPYRTHNFGHTEKRCQHSFSKYGENYYSVRISSTECLDVPILLCKNCKAVRFPYPSRTWQLSSTGTTKYILVPSLM